MTKPEGQPRSLKDVLLDPDGPHDIYVPPRGRFRLRRRPFLFFDERDEAANFPDWLFEINEISDSVYKVVATDSEGHRIEFSGTDVDDLHRRAVEAAKSIEAQCKNRI